MKTRDKAARKGVARQHSRKRLPVSKRLPVPNQQQRTNAFELLRRRRQGASWRDAEKSAGISRRKAEQIFPRAFFRDDSGHVQVRGYDPYTRRMKIPTPSPGQFKWLSVKGSHKATLVAQWNNAVKAAGRGDFSLLKAFPRGVFVGGVRLSTSHKKVTQIVAAAAESDKPFEDIYAMTRAA
jgi:hypothetical protein